MCLLYHAMLANCCGTPAVSCCVGPALYYAVVALLHYAVMALNGSASYSNIVVITKLLEHWDNLALLHPLNDT